MSYVVFWGVSIHAALAGTDASKPVYTLTAIVALSAVVFAASYRALSHHLPKRRAAADRPARPAQRAERADAAAPLLSLRPTAPSARRTRAPPTP